MVREGNSSRTTLIKAILTKGVPPTRAKPCHVPSSDILNRLLAKYIYPGLRNLLHGLANINNIVVSFPHGQTCLIIAKHKQNALLIIYIKTKMKCEFWCLFHITVYD